METLASFEALALLTIVALVAWLGYRGVHAHLSNSFAVKMARRMGRTSIDAGWQGKLLNLFWLLLVVSVPVGALSLVLNVVRYAKQ